MTRMPNASTLTVNAWPASRRVARQPALDVVNQVRRALAGIAFARAVCVGIGIGALVALAVLAATRLFGAMHSVFLGGVSGIATTGFVAWRVRRRAGVLTASRAALWLEERFPSLQFALVTLADDDSVATMTPAAFERLVSFVSPMNAGVPLRRAARAQLRWPAIVALLAIVTVSVLGPWLLRLAPISRALSSRAEFMRATPGRDNAVTFATWRVRVVPPAYSGLAAEELGDAGSVAALVGSRVEVAGTDRHAPTVSIRALTDSGALAAATRATATSDGWGAQFTMPISPAEVLFAEAQRARQLLLEPRADSLPVVRLTRPERDTVFRQPRGALTFEADAHDDLGLASAAFEMIVSSGEGERFTARTVVLSNRGVHGERESSWRVMVLLDTMHLEPGDIVHVRAVARDRHPDVTRGAGTSETRTLRVARPAEYDSVAVDPAPPPEVDKSLLSQRMLLMLTEKLEQRRPKLSRPVLVEESRSLASDQARLRKLVGSLVFQRLEGEGSAEHEHAAGDGHDHGMEVVNGKLVPSTSGGGSQVLDFDGDESPVVAINRPLLEAYNAMWDAASALDIADPKGAIPHMRIALLAIQRARSAERIYLRGKPPTLVVDIAKVRLAGRDTGQSNARVMREAVSPREAAREARLLSAATLLARDATAGRDSLALLRLEALGNAPAFAAALGEALDVARRGGDATEALIRARRLLEANRAPAPLGAWRGFP